MNARKTLLMGVPLLALSAWWLCREADSSPESAALSPAKPRHDAPSSAVHQRGGSLRELLTRLVKGGKPPQLTAEQLRAFVEKQGRSPSSLLAAWKLGGEVAWLDEAVQRFPDDPRVALAKLSTAPHTDPNGKIWIDRLKENDPGNATGWCYETLSLLQGGDTAAARDALAQVAQCERLDGYLKESRDTIAEAYRSAGFGALKRSSTPGFRNQHHLPDWRWKCSARRCPRPI